MQGIAYAIVCAIVALNSALIAHHMVLPEGIELYLWDIAHLLVVMFNLPIDLGFN